MLTKKMIDSLIIKEENTNFIENEEKDDKIINAFSDELEKMTKNITDSINEKFNLQVENNEENIDNESEDNNE